MSRKPLVLLSLCAVTTLAGACSPGSVPDVAPPDVERVECTTEYEVTGTFASSVTPRPTAAEGCVPQGTWTFNVSEAAGGDCTSTKFQAQYIVTIAGLGRGRTYTLTNPMGTAERDFGLSAGGGGECDLSLTEISPATGTKFHRFQAKPFTEPGGTVIAGSGTYTLWSSKP